MKLLFIMKPNHLKIHETESVYKMSYFDCEKDTDPWASTYEAGLQIRNANSHDNRNLRKIALRSKNETKKMKIIFGSPNWDYNFYPYFKIGPGKFRFLSEKNLSDDVISELKKCLDMTPFCDS